MAEPVQNPIHNVVPTPMPTRAPTLPRLRGSRGESEYEGPSPWERIAGGFEQIGNSYNELQQAWPAIEHAARVTGHTIEWIQNQVANGNALLLGNGQLLLENNY